MEHGEVARGEAAPLQEGHRQRVAQRQHAGRRGGGGEALVPFFALAATKGIETLWTTPARKLAAGSLLGLAAAQSLWITGSRLTREGAAEVQYRAGLVIREATQVRDRVLITIADQRQFTPYYADRYSAGVEPREPALMVHPSGARMPAPDAASLEKYVEGFDVVLVGDPERAGKEIAFFRGNPPPPSFRFLEETHPLRRALEDRAVLKLRRGAFVLYRMR
jgi:hypothetical protein